MKSVFVLLVICTLGFGIDHWQEIKEQRTLFVATPAPGMIIYGSKANPASVRLQAALTKQGIPFQKRDLDNEADSRELDEKMANLNRQGRHIVMPVAEIDGALIPGATYEQIIKRLK
jgi:hypothetical protein